MFVVWNVDSKTPIRLPASRAVRSWELAFSPDGRTPRHRRRHRASSSGMPRAAVLEATLPHARPLRQRVVQLGRPAAPDRLERHRSARLRRCDRDAPSRRSRTRQRLRRRPSARAATAWSPARGTTPRGSGTPEPGRWTRTLVGHTSQVLTVAFSPTRRRGSDRKRRRHVRACGAPPPTELLDSAFRSQDPSSRSRSRPTDRACGRRRHHRQGDHLRA